MIERNGIPLDPIWRRNESLVDTSVLTNHQFEFNSTTNVNELVISNVGLEDDSIEYVCSDLKRNINSSVVLNVTGKQCTTQSLLAHAIYRATIH